MRKIIHIDCDCFFAAVELRDQPQLKGLRVAVGGKARSRGVLSTCNYEARQFGLHSAMATAEAFRRCPQLILLPHRFQAYKDASNSIKEIFLRYTDKIEPLSLDEAYLDVSDSDLFKGSATLIAKDIRQHIKQEVGITASAGIAPNKFLAKVASDWQKPDGQFVIKPDEIAGFMLALPVEKIPGVGKSTMKKMNSLDVKSCADLQAIELYKLVKNFGAFGKRLHDLSFGIDYREIRTQRTRKSLSIERTFTQDLQSIDEAELKMPELFAELQQRLEKVSDTYTINKLNVKLKYSDFTATTIECQALAPDSNKYMELLQTAWPRKDLPVRLLGLGVGLAVKETFSRQLQLC